jgi:hypothetical protein
MNFKLQKIMTSILLILLLFSVFLALGDFQAHATTIFSDGFENGFSAWGTNGSPTLSSESYLGSYCALFTTSGAGESDCFKNLGIGYSDVYVRAYIKFDSVPLVDGGQCLLIALRNAAWQTLSGVRLSYDSAQGKYYFSLWNLQDSSYKGPSSYVTLNSNTYYCLEIRRLAGTNGHLELWFNGQSIFSWDGNTGADTAQIIFVGYVWSWQTLPSLFMDCVVAADTYVGPEGANRTPSPFKIGIEDGSWNFREYDVGTIAGTFDLSSSCWVNWLDPGQDYLAKVNKVHAINPNYKFLLYRNCMSIYSYVADEWNYARSQGWLLKDANGNYVTESNWGWADNYMVDITNSSYQQWLGAKLKSWLDQYPSFDGIEADNSLKYSAQEFESASGTRPINPRTGTYFTDLEILNGCSGLLNAIIDAIGTSKLLMPNGIWNGAIWYNTWPGGDNYRYILSKVPRLNCLASEGTFMAPNNQWYTEALWKNSVDFVGWVQDNFLSGHPERYFLGECLTYALPPNATVEQVLQYGYCSMMLGVSYSMQNTLSFGFSNNFLPDSSTTQLTQTLRNVDMGTPLGGYYKIPSTSVYARDFARGKVFVNPTDTKYAVALGTTYTTISGSVVSGSLLIDSHSGVSLFQSAFSGGQTVFTDGFENGFNSWSGTNGNPTVTSSILHSASYSARFSVVGQGSSNCFRVLNTGYSYISMQAYYRFDTLPLTNGSLTILNDVRTLSWKSLTTVALVYDSAQSKYCFYVWNNQDSSYKGPSEYITLSNNAWFSLRISRLAGASGHLELEFNGQIILSWDGNTGSDNAQIMFVGYVWNWVQLPNIWIDDVSIKAK